MFCVVLGMFGIYTAQAQDSTSFYIESFDTVTPPDLPAGWSDESTLWETSSSVASPGSGVNNIKATGAGAGAVQTAMIDLSGMTAGTLQYWARRTSSYEQDSLLVTASVGGDTSFSIVLLDKGQALPTADATYELMSVSLPAELVGNADVILRFEALGGSTSGANIRVDDVEVIGTGEPAASVSTFGFASEASSADELTGIFEVPLYLDFTNAEKLQGIQFSITWDTGAFSLTDVIRGSAIADTEAWQLNFDSRPNELRVVLLGNPTDALSAGLFDPVMTLQFTVDAGNSDASSELTLSSVLGALAVRTGDDAGLVLGQATHAVTLTTGGAAFSVDVSSLDLGTVAIDLQGQSTVTVTNTGTVDLVISSVTTDNGVFMADPISATVSAGAAQAFSITFAPTFTDFGYQAGTVVFEHNAVGSSNSVSVTGIGTGGRGDTNEDGLVDAVDLVQGVDFVLDVVTPDAEQLLSADVFPFVAPDGTLDVRDLTVTSQAIVLNIWPDDSPLPVPSPEAESGKLGSNQHHLALESVQEGGQLALYLEISEPIRAVQFELKAEVESQIVLDAGVLRDEGASFYLHHDIDAREMRILGVKLDGTNMTAGRHRIALLPIDASTNINTLHNAFAVSAEGSRLPIRLLENAAVSNEETNLVQEIKLYQPFPNPLDFSISNTLFIPFSNDKTQHVQVQVFDILGRSVSTLAGRLMPAGQHQVTWDGEDGQGMRVAPGLYLVRLSTSSGDRARVVVVR